MPKKALLLATHNSFGIQDGSLKHCQEADSNSQATSTLSILFGQIKKIRSAGNSSFLMLFYMNFVCNLLLTKLVSVLVKTSSPVGAWRCFIWQKRLFPKFCSNTGNCLLSFMGEQELACLFSFLGRSEGA